MPNFGEYADPGPMVELAVLAEGSGWDGFFVWDHIVVADGMTVADPWVLLGAIAQATEHISIGPMVTPLPRRRPWVVARQATTIDHLSNGRLILGVGIGFPPDEEFGTFGEPTGDRERADMLDEGLAVLAGMWSGERFDFSGRHYSVRSTRFAPTPLQQPTIPIWVAGMWPNRRPLRRAGGHQGVFPVKIDMTPWSREEVAELTAIMRRERGPDDDFAIVVGGSFEIEPELAAAHARAGATWYLAGPAADRSLEDVRRAIAAGPAVS